MYQLPAIAYGIALVIFVLSLAAVRIAPIHNKVLLRALIASVLLAPGLLVDAEAINWWITPWWFGPTLYGIEILRYRAVSSIPDFLQLAASLGCTPFAISGPIVFLISWGVGRLLSRHRGANADVPPRSSSP